MRAYSRNTWDTSVALLERLAPAIQSIMSNTEGTFAEIFKQFQTFDAAGGHRVMTQRPSEGRPAVTLRDTPAEGGSQ